MEDSLLAIPPRRTRRLRARAKSLLLFLFAAAIIGSAAWRTRGPRDPAYHGKRLSKWLYEEHSDTNGPELNREEYEALERDGVPWLVWAVEHGQSANPDEPAERSAGAQWIHDLWRKLLHRHFRESYDERGAALMALEDIGPDAAPAIPALEPLLKDTGGWYAQGAAQALVAIGPAAWPAIDRGLDVANAEVRFTFVHYITGWMNASSPTRTDDELAGCVKFILKASAAEDRSERRSAMVDWGESRRIVGPRLDAVAVPIFISSLSASAVQMREAALLGLWWSGKAADPAIPALQKRLAEPDEEAENLETATKILIDLIGVGSAAQPVIESSFRDGSPSARDVLIGELATHYARIYPRPSEAEARWYLDFMVRASADPEPVVRSHAAKCIPDVRDSGLGERFETVGLARLLELLDDADANVRVAAIQALGMCGRAEKHCISRLQELAAGPESDVQSEAKKSLEKLSGASFQKPLR